MKLRAMSPTLSKTFLPLECVLSALEAHPSLLILVVNECRANRRSISVVVVTTTEVLRKPNARSAILINL